MDRKTLEYLEERSKKARGIVSRIDQLKEKESRLCAVNAVSFFPEKRTENKIHCAIYGDRLLINLTAAIGEEIKAEIELLEQELIEL